MKQEAIPPRRPFPLGRRALVYAGILAAGLWAYSQLGLTLGDLVPGRGGMRVFREFFGSALSPALTWEGSSVPAGAPPFLFGVFDAARRTVVFAAAGVSLSVLFGILLGFLASSAWWEGDPAGARSPFGRFFRRAVAPAVWTATRTLIALMRSVHELLWALLFLAAFGLNTFAAVIAIAIPYAGTLAKIFSEMIDETSRDSAAALRGAGAGPVAVFAFGLLPRALPDMTAYTFYRTECAIRSAAVLGFFGYETLGYHLRATFDNLHYTETWTYLYAVFALVAIVDGLSGAVRRRLVSG